MLSFETSGSFQKTESFFAKMLRGDFQSELHQAGAKGVAALSAATPIDSGLTAASWDYEVKRSGVGYTLSWTNRHVVNGVPIAILIQYGHGTGTGGYVAGRDYINPALRAVFDNITQTVWKEVTSA